MMYEGFAMGGPRDGVKLTAGARWDGRVQTPEATAKVPKYFKGRYEWDWDFRAWVWHADKPVEKAGTPRLVG